MKPLLSKIPRALRPVVEEAIGRGCWELEKPSGNSHFKMRHRSGRCILIANTPSDNGRGVVNLRGDLRRMERDYGDEAQDA